MPKRVVDGEGLWTSSKLGRVKPVRFRAEYANLLPLALGNGVFECNPQSIWARVYSCNRPDIQPKDVRAILREYEQVKLLFRWQDPDGRWWGYWTGIEKSGRLPAPSRIQRKEQFCGPTPPQEGLSSFLDSVSTGYVRNTCIGSGSGSGSGSGTSASKEQKPRSASSKKQLEPDGFFEFWKVYPNKKAKSKAQEAFQRLSPTPELLNMILKAIHQYKASEDWRKEKGRYIPYPASFLNGRRWEDEIAPPGGNGEAGGSLTQEELYRLKEGKREREPVTA